MKNDHATRRESERSAVAECVRGREQELIPAALRSEGDAYHVGIGWTGAYARNHAICEGPHILARVNGAGYPIAVGWHPRTEALTAWIVAAMNEKARRDGPFAWEEPPLRESSK